MKHSRPAPNLPPPKPKQGRGYASRLQRLTNDALDKAAELSNEERLIMGAINWGDLGCCDVEERRSLLKGTSFVAVCIEEASPDATGLQNYVGKYLEEHGHGDVYVSTEW
jgi:hypothetical protein